MKFEFYPFLSVETSISTTSDNRALEPKKLLQQNLISALLLITHTCKEDNAVSTKLTIDRFGEELLDNENPKRIFRVIFWI